MGFLGLIMVIESARKHYPSIQGNPNEFTAEKLNYSGIGYGLTGGYRIEASDSGIFMFDSSAYSGDTSLVKFFTKTVEST